MRAGHPKMTATEITTLRGAINSVVSISLNDVNSSDWTSKQSFDCLLVKSWSVVMVEPSGIEPLTS